jgi:serine O-acetyltransferase
MEGKLEGYNNFKTDFYRTIGKPFSLKSIKHLISHPALRYQLYRRILPDNILTRCFTFPIVSKYGLEFSTMKNIGKGLFIAHPYGITINSKAEIGENCNLAKGVTIGQENRGLREGAPHIGNCVWIGVNATVVGKITIGDDVMIAPNSFVNCDVPSHSIVLGNPCRIIPKEKATEGYICNI